MSSRAFVGYARVSTSDQGDDGASLSAQVAALEAHAVAQGAELVAVVTEVASARTLERPELARALELARARGAALVVVKLDRLTRSVRDLGELLATAFGPGGGVELVSVRDAVDTQSPAGRLVLHVLVSVAQWERETIAERTRHALDHLRSSGSHLGRPPFGFRLTRVDGRAVLEADPLEAPALARMLELGARGMRAAAIAVELERDGHRTRSGRPWSAKVVRLCLHRHRHKHPATDLAAGGHL